MTRLLMLVGGQAEEIFVKKTLTPYLALQGVAVEFPILIWTKRIPSGGGFFVDVERSATSLERSNRFVLHIKTAKELEWLTPPPA